MTLRVHVRRNRGLFPSPLPDVSLAARSLPRVQRGASRPVDASWACHPPTADGCMARLVPVRFSTERESGRADDDDFVPGARTGRGSSLKTRPRADPDGAKRWVQERVASRCRCGGQLLVIAQESDGRACGARISVDITYRHKCPDCFATAKRARSRSTSSTWLLVSAPERGKGGSERGDRGAGSTRVVKGRGNQ